MKLVALREVTWKINEDGLIIMVLASFVSGCFVYGESKSTSVFVVYRLESAFSIVVCIVAIAVRLIAIYLFNCYLCT